MGDRTSGTNRKMPRFRWPAVISVYMNAKKNSATQNSQTPILFSMLLRIQMAE